MNFVMNHAPDAGEGEWWLFFGEKVRMEVVYLVLII